MRFEKYNWDFFSKAAILLFLTVMLIFQTLSPSYPFGESSSYMLAAISLENRFSLRITEEDIALFQSAFPMHYENLTEHINSNRFPVSPRNGSAYPWYFGTYSFLCIPMMNLLRFAGLSQAHAFPITNVLLFAAALYYVFKKLQAERKTVFLTVLFLACSPAIAYLWWPSAEVFIFSFVIISIVNLYNGKHKKAALYISIAGTMNTTAMVIGMAIIFDYFWINIAECNSRNIVNIIKALWEKVRDILKLAACFAPFIVSTTFNIITFGSLTATTSVDQFSVFNNYGDWSRRFLAYMFDLNLGFLPYFQIALLLFIIFVLYGMIKLKRESFVFAFAFFGTMGAYSLMYHINSGMSGISRYNVWLSPVLIIYVCTQIPTVLSKYVRLRNALLGLTCFSIILTSALSGYTLLRRPLYVTFSPVARAVLNNMPSLYNPIPSTFISRSHGVDGGYYDLWSYGEPVVYSDSNGLIRKILVPAGIDTDRDWFMGNSNDIDSVVSQMRDIGKREYVYINLWPPKELFIYQEAFNPAAGDSGVYSSNGFYHIENNAFAWLSPNARILLAESNKQQTGIKIIYATPLPLIPINNDNSDIFVRIYINDVLMSNLPYEQADWNNPVELYIEGSQLPEAINGMYEIKIITGGVYNPYAMGISSDRRDLATQLLYIGIPN